MSFAEVLAGGFLLANLANPFVGAILPVPRGACCLPAGKCLEVPLRLCPLLHGTASPGKTCKQTVCRKPVCGNGFLEFGEECDQDGFNSDTRPNTCRKNCRRPWCGDGVKDTGEQCDNGIRNSDTQADACRTTCKLPRCGDGVKDGAEECDNGAANSDTTPGACRTTCRLPRCGDRVIDTGETCDDGNTTEGDGCLFCQTERTCCTCEYSVDPMCEDDMTEAECEEEGDTVCAWFDGRCVSRTQRDCRTWLDAQTDCSTESRYLLLSGTENPALNACTTLIQADGELPEGCTDFREILQGCVTECSDADCTVRLDPACSTFATQAEVDQWIAETTGPAWEESRDTRVTMTPEYAEYPTCERRRSYQVSLFPVEYPVCAPGDACFASGTTMCLPEGATTPLDLTCCMCGNGEGILAEGGCPSLPPESPACSYDAIQPTCDAAAEDLARAAIDACLRAEQIRCYERKGAYVHPGDYPISLVPEAGGCRAQGTVVASCSSMCLP